MKLYVCGPMSGRPMFNIPTFDRVAKELRDKGHEVVSPAELDNPLFREICVESIDGELDKSMYSWGELLARDVQIIADDGIEGIVVLPGWMGSRGAALETFVGRLCGLPIFHSDNGLRVSHGTLEHVHSAALNIEAEDIKIIPKRRILPLNECGIAPTMLRREDGEWATTDTAESVQADGEVRITSASGGQKGSKQAVLGDTCPKALTELAKVSGFGRQKYARLNYLKGYDWSLSYDALQRHLQAFWGGEDADEESGLSHLAHAAWHCLALLAFQLRGVGTDDRP